MKNRQRNNGFFFQKILRRTIQLAGKLRSDCRLNLLSSHNSKPTLLIFRSENDRLLCPYPCRESLTYTKKRLNIILPVSERRQTQEAGNHSPAPFSELTLLKFPEIRFPDLQNIFRYIFSCFLLRQTMREGCSRAG